jgi:hypothetical protein
MKNFGPKDQLFKTLVESFEQLDSSRKITLQLCICLIPRRRCAKPQGRVLRIYGIPREMRGSLASMASKCTSNDAGPNSIRN